MCDTVPCYGIMIWCIDMVPWYGSLVWCHDMVSCFGTMILYHASIGSVSGSRMKSEKDMARFCQAGRGQPHEE